MNYKSSITILGLPLVHVAIGAAENAGNVRGVAKGWIAIGDIAVGVIFAVGGFAFGGICIGGVSVGVLSIAGVSIGLWALGGLAIGVFAMGGGAVALWAAKGGVAVAGEYAMGGYAVASNANSEAALIYLNSSTFFQISTMLMQYSRWLLALIVIAPLYRLIANRRRDA